ncbi:MAG: hypothetical protein HUJ76_12570, partial [Parasporobacterium sp.]|nr:hypothetical protein [Parasporobacterium sp.]
SYAELPEGIKFYDTAQQRSAEKYKWYSKEVTLITATKYMLKNDGTPVCDPINGVPLNVPFVTGESVMAVLFRGTTEEDLQPPKTSSSGIGIGLNVYANDNTAYIKNAAVTASGVFVDAKAGEKTRKDPKDEKKTITLTNGSYVAAKAGYRSGNKGLAGSIAANYVNEDIKAYIENAVITVKNGKDVIVKADSNLNTKASTSAVGGLNITGSAIKSTSAAGIGVTGDVVMEDVDAYISADTKITGAGNLAVIAASKGSTVDSASSGENTSGNENSMGAVGISLVDSDVKAELKGDDTAQALKVTGDVTVKATSERTASITSGATAKGAVGAKGITVGLAIATFDTNAIINREITGSRNITVEADAKNGGNAATYAGTMGCSPKKENGDDNIRADEAAGNALGAAGDMAFAGGAINDDDDDDDDDPEVPQALPVRPDTAEGSVEWAGTIALLIYNNTVNAYIKKNTVSTGAL